jgi:hypothetical protein
LYFTFILIVHGKDIKRLLMLGKEYIIISPEDINGDDNEI